jgi:hypothetical protein
MAASDLENSRSATLFLDLHGEEAIARARDMVRTMRERGDNDGADAWLRIIVAIEAKWQRMNGGLLQ